MKGTLRIFRRPFWIKLTNWEFWSFGMIYSWIFPVWFLLCLRARSLFFFSAANPSIRNGGFLSESKKQIHALLPGHLYPRTLHFAKGTAPGQVWDTLAGAGFMLPLIGKPDTGGRGRGVKLLPAASDVTAYAERAACVDFHVQEFIPFENEVGIFYYRYPGQHRGKISGIVRKEFLTVTGNGKDNIRQLLISDKRSVLYLRSLEKIYGDKLQEVPAKGEKLLLVPYGNHARGSKFLDDSHLADEQLLDVIDGICHQLRDFYYGRLDIRYKTWEGLLQGTDFSVIEVNGAGAEPTHIYDPRHSLFFAWKEIVRHWIILCRISRINHKAGHRYLSIREGIRMFREDREHNKKLALLPE